MIKSIEQKTYGVGKPYIRYPKHYTSALALGTLFFLVSTYRILAIQWEPFSDNSNSILSRLAHSLLVNTVRSFGLDFLKLANKGNLKNPHSPPKLRKDVLIERISS